MNKEYKRVGGIFSITKNNKFFIDNRELRDDDVVHLNVRTLKSIIVDAKNGII